MLKSRATTVVAGAAVIALLGAGAGFAAASITSGDIVNETIRSKDVKDGTLKTQDLNAGLQTKVKDTTTVYLTPPSDVPVFQGANVEEVPASPRTGPDSETTLLTFELDKGKYLIDGTAQFFHFVPSPAVDDEDYGIISLKVEGSDEQGTSWTGDIPESGNDAGQTNATTYLVIPEDDTELRVVGSIRGERPGQAGAQAVVTKLG